MPAPLMTRETTIELEKSIINYMPSMLLMEQAGQCVAREVIKECCYDDLVWVVCGPGNNGGDGFVVARALAQTHLHVHVLIVGDAKNYTRDAQTMLSALAGYPTIEILNQAEVYRRMEEGICPEPNIIVDALFGIGLNRPITGNYAKIIKWINERPALVIAIDIPSGIDANCGSVLGVAVQAQKTVSFFAPKVGHVMFPGRAYKGQLIMDLVVAWESIVQLANSFGVTELMRSDDMTEAIPVRNMADHKGRFGHALIVGGSVGMAGAAFLAAKAALRSGAGRVSLCVEKEIAPALWSALPEAMAHIRTDKTALKELIIGKNALAMGPGMGAKNIEQIQEVLDEIYAFEGNAVIDAGGLHYVDKEKINKEREPHIILTPHPKEMAHLMGISMEEVLNMPIRITRQCAKAYHAIVLLKGGSSVIAKPDGTVSITTSGGPMLAKGGSGDVLTGIIAALLAQGHEPYDAARYGALLLGEAGECVDKYEASVIATDVIEAIPKALKGIPGAQRDDL